ncbi:MAG: IS21 family transposase, partial [Bacillota bacterium]|nr:IS21 family transposase [Bacillota bacterium]
EINLWIHGKKNKFYIAAICSPASGFRWAYLYTNMQMEVFIDSHARFFEMLGGSYKEGVYDNCRCVVSKFIGRNEKELNKELIKLSLYYDYEINVTNCFSGWEKGSVEGSVKWIRNKVFATKYEFDSFDDAAIHLENRLKELNANSKISEEMKHLKPYRPKYEAAYINEHTVDKYSFVTFEKNHYSVPDTICGKKVLLKSYPNEIEIYYKGKKIACHKRLCGEKKTCIDIRHYLHTLEKKPGALKNSAALKSLPELKKIFDIYYTDKPKTFIEILRQNKDKSIEDIIESVTPVSNYEETRRHIEDKTSQQIEELMKLFTGGNYVYH